MPMGGKGDRFAKRGYDLPKPLISIYGKPFFYWATMSILKFNDIIDLTFVILKEHILKYNIDQHILKYFPHSHLVILEDILNGPVLTCLKGIEEINDSFPILFNDCDHLFKSEELNLACSFDSLYELDGALVTFTSNLPQYSYVKFNDRQEVIGTVEKVVVSNQAICGAYLFKNVDLFKRLASSYLQNCEYKEFFISGMYNEMAKICKNISIFKADYHVPFGIPEEYDLALKDEHYKELE